MKLKNIVLGMKVVVKENSPLFKEGEIVRVVGLDLEDDECDVKVSNDSKESYWLNHKNIKKLKEV